jgi:4-amino-4-deoxy-L-arabinose transferase-like glycosyltransferase
MVLEATPVRRPLFEALAISLVCVPLFFLGMGESHDWGDDNSQYIHQARNIVEGAPQSQTGYLYNKAFADMGPQAYPIGFPLLLTPVYYFFGNNIRSFFVVESLFLFLLCFAVFAYYRHFFPLVLSIIATLVIGFNPYALQLKHDVIADIPFAFFLMACVTLFLTKGISRYVDCILLGALAGFLICIKPTGAAFFFALFCMFVEELVAAFKQKKLSRSLPAILGRYSALVLVSFALWYLLSKVIFHIPSENSYWDQLSGIGLATIHDNVNYYFVLVRDMFPFSRSVYFLNIFTTSTAFTCMFLGFMRCMTNKRGFIDYLVIGFMGMLIFWPSQQGIRFVLPVMPFLVRYMIIGLEMLRIDNARTRNMLAVAFGLLVLVQYLPPIAKMAARSTTVVEGPQEKESTEAFSFIKNNTPENAVIVFRKPRALALYTGRTCWANEQTEDYNLLESRFNSVGARYILVNSSVSDETIKDYIAARKDKVRLMWENPKFSLFERPREARN